MPDTPIVTFNHRELAEILVKHHNIHEGFWGVYIEFALGAANVGPEPGGNVVPAAIVPVNKIGIQRFAEGNNLTVDAAVVNPA